MSDAEHKVSPAIIAAFLANLGIAAAKLIGFLFTGASSLLAEAAHSAADTGNQALLIVGGRKARRAPTDAHPFGHSGERYFWAFVVAVVLFTAGGLFALYEGVDRLIHPHRLESAGWAVGILLIAIALESFSLRTAMREAREPKRRDGGSWWAFIRRSKSPELPVVLLEDTGALLGLAIALAGIIVAEITGNARFDAAGSLTIGALLFAIALFLGVEMKSLLLGEAASAEQLRALSREIESAPSVRRLIHMRTMHLGPDDLLVAAKVEFSSSLGYQGLAGAIDDVEARMRAAVPAAKLIFLEPDAFKENLSPPSPTTP
ncbi:MAG: cation diffusion facilitator family transporter [Actinobacteria bacterium]|nr:cation diffusion facilitator family transporter [Actinomycetota bacterium]